MGCECGICRGRYGNIHYDEPSDHEHPLSFVIDEIIPISSWREFGYNSSREAAEDWNNLQAAHYICNQLKSNKIEKIGLSIEPLNNGNKIKKYPIVLDGDW